MSKNSISREIQINAEPHAVWAALTDAKEFGAWFQVALDGPFVIGETTTGKMTYPGSEGIPWVSVTEMLDAPKRFLFRWPDCPPGEDPGPDTHWLTVDFNLQPQDGGTLVTVTETGFDALPEERRVSMLRSNREGWEIQTKNLKNHVER